MFIPDLPSADKRNTAAWEARFDLPGAPPIPEPPTIVPPQLQVVQVNSNTKRDTRNANGRRMQSERK
jgi:hypothetical protein